MKRLNKKWLSSDSGFTLAIGTKRCLALSFLVLLNGI